MKKIAIFASGSGSNAEAICRHFEDSLAVEVSLILTNNPNAGVVDRAKTLRIPCKVFSVDELQNGQVLQILQQKRIDLIALAGFLKMIPSNLIEGYPDRIINIHPALLPDYGGQGMYGMNVHQAVYDNEEEETGITIHYVNENYDEGDIIFQDSVELAMEDEPEDIAGMVQDLEHKHYASVIESIAMDLE